MSVTQPRWMSAALDIQIALDAARMILASAKSVEVRCRDESLMPDIRLRFDTQLAESGVDGLIWIDPDLNELGDDQFGFSSLESFSQLVVVVRASRKRFGHLMVPVPAGSCRGLRTRLHGAGFDHVVCYGVHSPESMVLFRIGSLFARVGRLDIGDRIRHRAQLSFLKTGHLSQLSMVQVLVASRGAA